MQLSPGNAGLPAAPHPLRRRRADGARVRDGAGVVPAVGRERRQLALRGAREERQSSGQGAAAAARGPARRPSRRSCSARATSTRACSRSASATSRTAGPSNSRSPTTAATPTISSPSSASRRERACYREAAESAAVVRAQLAANREPMRRLGAVLRRRRAARRRDDRARQLRSRGDLRALPARDALRRADVVGGAVGQLGLCRAAGPRAARSASRSRSRAAVPTCWPPPTRRAPPARLVVALVNAEDAPLAARADHVVWLRAGARNERRGDQVAHRVARGDPAARRRMDATMRNSRRRSPSLPDGLERAWQLDWSAAIETLKDARSLFVLGRGLGLGVAQEAALKLKETAGLHAEGISAAELRHGPMALVQSGFPVLLFAQDDETQRSNADARRPARGAGCGARRRGPARSRARSSCRRSTRIRPTQPTAHDPELSTGSPKRSRARADSIPTVRRTSRK